MAWLELDRSGTYLIAFRFGGVRFKKSLGTRKKTEADSRLQRLEENLKLVDEGRLEVPDNGSVAAFLLSDGKLNAKREFEEETGLAPKGVFIPLKPIQQKGGKIVHAWAFEGDCDPAAIKSNFFTMEWPPKSGRQIQVPEIDRAEFFGLDEARTKIKAGQEALIDELEVILTKSDARSQAKP